jgi:hypothetical protein
LARKLRLFNCSGTAAIESLHTEVGLIHCDIKLRNLVWFAGPKKFKAIGFGAAQGDGNELQKRTIANLPPQQGRHDIFAVQVSASSLFDLGVALR